MKNRSLYSSILIVLLSSLSVKANSTGFMKDLEKVLPKVDEVAAVAPLGAAIGASRFLTQNMVKTAGKTLLSCSGRGSLAALMTKIVGVLMYKEYHSQENKGFFSRILEDTAQKENRERLACLPFVMAAAALAA